MPAGRRSIRRSPRSAKCWKGSESKKRQRKRPQMLRGCPQGKAMPREADLPFRSRQTHLLHQCATALGKWPKSLVGGDGGDQLVVVVRILRLFRLLHLEQ